jgi:hypothetical protein
MKQIKYYLYDGEETEVTKIVKAVQENKARLIHSRGILSILTSLSLDGIDRDTRGQCYSMWEEVWTTIPKNYREALRVAQYELERIK